MSKIGYRCCKCGSRETYKDGSGKDAWYNDYDKNGNWTGEHICYECMKEIKRSKTKKIKEKYLKEKICCKCGSIKTSIKGIDFQGNNIYHWYTCMCKKTGCTGYLCYSCWHSDYYKKDPNSYFNTIRPITCYRTGEFSIEDNRYPGYITELVVCKTLKISNYNIDTDNFLSKFDLYFLG